MAVTHDVRPLSRRDDESLGPQVMFAAALLLAAAAWIVATWSFTSDHTLPLVATLLFALAAILRWWPGAATPAAPDHLTYWDVAARFAFIGIGAAA